jgi:hypothetical protein
MLTEFCIAALCVFRLAYMLAYEDGPWDVLYRIRLRLGHSTLGNLMDCPGCSSVWISFIITAIVWGFNSNYVINCLALSSVTVIIANIIGDKDGKNSS